jgi:hypothetical protein
MPPMGCTVRRVNRIWGRLAETRTSTSSRLTLLMTEATPGWGMAVEATNTQSAPVDRMAWRSEPTSPTTGRPSSHWPPSGSIPEPAPGDGPISVP